MRLIDADALIVELQKDEERFDKEADDCRKNSRNYTDCYIQAMSSRADGIRDAIVEIIDAPSIDIEPKRGEWVRVGNVAHTEHKCSVCGKNPTRIVVDTKLVDNYFCSMAEPITEYIFGELLSDFCPNCGADMREVRNE